MTRRRLAAVALVAALVGGAGSVPLATAGPVAGAGDVASDADVLDGAVGGPGVLDVASARDRYWACLAVEQVDIGTCIENPLPDASRLPSIRDLLDLTAPGAG